MEASGRFGMLLHQAVSFSRALIKIPRTDAVFFPGCALLGYDPELLKHVMLLLRKEEPNIALAAGCCGQPTKSLEPSHLFKRTEKLRRLFVKKNVRRIYTACPNCTVMLSRLACADVIPVWETLNRVSAPEDYFNHSSASFALHDPCPVRQDFAQQNAVRELLQKANVSITEFPKNREQTACCGNIAMLRTIDPAKSANMRNTRLDELPSNLSITSYCAGCVDAFSSEGRETAHLVELLFGKSNSRGWGNRIRNTILSRKE